MEIVRRPGFTLYMGGMVQVQGAFLVGDEAALDFDDPADTEGFRVRRARFGFGGTLFGDWGFYLAADLKDAVVAAQGGDQGNEILDATIEWRRFAFARVTAGVDKVPFSALALLSSSRLLLIERPLMLRHIVPERRVGLTVEGDLWRVQYAAGLYNGSDGVTSGNRLAGLSGAAHVQLHILGKPQTFVPHKLRVSLGGGYMYEDGPAVDSHRASANLLVELYRTRLQAEYLWMQTSPDTEPTGGPIEAGDTSRWGVAGELSAFVWKELVQVAVRYEYYRDLEDLPTFGTQQLITGGVNIYLYRDSIKLQLNYINRDERDGPKVENDIGYAQLQAMF
jgi:phosphate-selective porin